MTRTNALPDALPRCAVCDSVVDEEDLFCANCGAESPHPEGARLEYLELEAINFSCGSCGASMNYDAREQALRCPFCGAHDLEQQDGQRLVKPDRVVLAAIDREDIERRFRKWCQQNFWRPSDLASDARLTEITLVYVPFWVFRADTSTYWTADSSQTPSGARGDWFPLFGEHEERIENVLVPASGGLALREVLEVSGSFDLRAGKPPEECDLDRVTVEQFGFGRKYARRLARRRMRSHLRERCAERVPGRARNVHVNVLYQGIAGRPLLLPFWIMAYRYKNRVYRFLANAQTGESTGTAPFSWAKLIVVVLLAVAGTGLVLLILALILSR